MHRTSTREPQFRHTKREPKLRHVDSRELFEVSTSSSEEEDSTERGTEETCEETTESHDSNFLHKRSEWTNLKLNSEEQRNIYKTGSPNKFIINPYIRNRGGLKQDKITQKNLLSPFPSQLIPPIPRQIPPGPYYKMSSVRSPRKGLNDFRNIEQPQRNALQQSRSYEEEENELCMMNQNYENKERKVREKYQAQKQKYHPSKTSSPERVLTGLHRKSAAESAGHLLKFPLETQQEEFSTSRSTRRPKTSAEENSKNYQIKNKCSDYINEEEIRGKTNSRRKQVVETTSYEKDVQTEKPFLDRNFVEEKLRSRGAEVKEKLVYVVEEEGKDVTKLETDLFTLNEILAIKKDLLELSEFAKKLKKLKEMRNDSKNEKTKESKCQCKQAEELLKNVNRRIEALETRQGELEKGNNRHDQKGDIETESKKTNVLKMSSGSLSKTPIMFKPSAVTTVPSFPKTEIFVARPGFSNNSDIVNELMDIKTQLLRLEKRRMSKEGTNKSGHERGSKSSKKKQQAIAVFSSRTYILTPDNFERKKFQDKITDEGKKKDFLRPIEDKSRTIQTKANVSDWLKNVSIDHSESDVTMFLSMKELRKKNNSPEETEENTNVKCKNCAQTLKLKDFKNQEPPKNRAPGTVAKGKDNNIVYVMKNEPSIIGLQKCYMTPSGRIFTLRSKSSEKVFNVSSMSKPRESPQMLLSRAIRRSVSSGTIPSAILAKEQIRRLKAQKRRNRRNNDLKPRARQSKSMQELSLSSSIYKNDKIARNKNLKSIGKIKQPLLPKDKEHNEDENEFFKYFEAHMMALKKNFEKYYPSTSSYSYSEFLASVNLDTQPTSAAVEPANLRENADRNQLYAYTASTKTKRNGLDSLFQQGEYSKSLKKAEEKLKKEAKLECIQKSKPKKEGKCKEQQKLKEFKEKNNNETENRTKYGCRYKDRVQRLKSDSRKNSDEEDYQFSHERKLLRSQDSLELYRKRQKDKNKSKLNYKKQSVSSFTIKNILRNIGRHYPKISNFHLFPFMQESCNLKKAGNTKLKSNKEAKRKGKYKRKEMENKDDRDDDNHDEEDVEETTASGTCVCQSCNSDYKDDCSSQKSKPHHLKNCKCVKVYLQSQEQSRKWPGVAPFKASSAETITSISTSRTSQSITSKFEKRDYLLPKQISQVQYVGHVTESCYNKEKSEEIDCCNEETTCKKDKCCKKKCCKKDKCCKKKHKKDKCCKKKCCKKDRCCKKKCCKKDQCCKKKCCKKDKYCKKKCCKKDRCCKKKCCKKDMCYKKKCCKKDKCCKPRNSKNKCVCITCGHVHKTKKKKCSKKCKICECKIISMCDCECECKCECKHECKCTKKPICPPNFSPDPPCFTEPKNPTNNKQNGDIFPFMSFFHNFCKSKPNQGPKSSKSALNKFNEVRCMKTCPPGRKISFLSKWRDHMTSQGHTQFSMENSCDFVSKLEDIENRLGKLEKTSSCDDDEEEDQNCCQRKETSCCCSRESYESKSACASGVEFHSSCDEDKMSKKKKNKFHQKKCDCCESEEDVRNGEEAAACYYVIQSTPKEKPPKESTSKTTSSKTTEEEKSCQTLNSKELLLQKKNRLKENFSSLYYFLKSIRNNNRIKRKCKRKIC